MIEIHVPKILGIILLTARTTSKSLVSPAFPYQHHAEKKKKKKASSLQFFMQDHTLYKNSNKLTATLVLLNTSAKIHLLV